MKVFALLGALLLLITCLNMLDKPTSDSKLKRSLLSKEVLVDVRMKSNTTWFLREQNYVTYANTFDGSRFLPSLQRLFLDKVKLFLYPIFGILRCLEVSSTNPDTLAYKQIGNKIIGSNNTDMMGYSVALSFSGAWLASGGKEKLELYEERYWKWNMRRDLSHFVTQIAHAISFSSHHSNPHLVVSDGDFDDLEVLQSYVYVFRYDNSNSNWIQLGETISGLSHSDGFGYSVDISSNGDYIAVGAPLEKYVQLFAWNEDNKWMLQTQINGTYGFGHAVCLSDDAELIVVGNPLSYSKTGSVSIHSSVSNSLEFDTIHELLGDNKEDWFGNSLAISGDGFFIASGTFNQPWQNRAPYVKVFQLNATRNLYEQVAENIVGKGNFGSSLSFTQDGRKLIVGGWNSPGKISLYDVFTDSWIENGVIIGEKTDSSLGFSVDISSLGNRFAFGSPQDVGTKDQLGWVAVCELS